MNHLIPYGDKSVGSHCLFAAGANHARTKSPFAPCDVGLLTVPVNGSGAIFIAYVEVF